LRGSTRRLCNSCRIFVGVCGHEYIARNPRRRDEHVGSFKVNLISGRWADFALTDIGGGDPVSLAAYLANCGQVEAARRLSDMLGIGHVEATGMFAPLMPEECETARGNSSKIAPTKTPIIPVPIDAPVFNFRHPKHGEPAGKWAYHQGDGALIAYAVRFDFETGGEASKEVIPVTFCSVNGVHGGYRAWRSCGVPAPRPLYRLPQLTASPGTPTIITEGEKKADRAVELFPDYEATTTMGGAKAPHLSHFAPLDGRLVIIWPDNDDVGHAFARNVAQPPSPLPLL
jgi:hypothetical protein